MRERRQTLLPSVLALTLVTLLVAPIAVIAASGLPATVTMDPESADPGATVEVTGLDFPASREVELQLTTSAGVVALGTVETADGGYFRQAVTLPADAPPGFWELRATGPDEVVAVHVFQAGEAPLPVVADEGVVEEAPATSRGGNSPADIMVLLVFAFLIAAVGGAGAYVWHQTRTGGAQPGMARGEDPIWSGAGEDAQASLGAADEPIWSPAHSDS